MGTVGDAYDNGSVQAQRPDHPLERGSIQPHHDRQVLWQAMTHQHLSGDAALQRGHEIVQARWNSHA
jgi:hypothetical protein